MRNIFRILIFYYLILMIIMISLIPYNNNVVKYDRENYESFMRYKNYLLNNKINIGSLKIGDNIIDDYNYAFKIKSIDQNNICLILPASKANYNNIYKFKKRKYYKMSFDFDAFVDYSILGNYYIMDNRYVVSNKNEINVKMSDIEIWNIYLFDNTIDYYKRY